MSCEGKPVLFIDLEGTLYPVALSEEQQNLLTMSVSLFSPIKIIKDKPQGTVTYFTKENQNETKQA
ncbi:hypothetical protein KM914_14425 [Virgibacillus pantothenticus]|uniref:hypothetical protein n=1 Tax=Virgibacillus pantothenticus TaxID=1473 RepID=UPI001C22D943|nr:hypothetical protein [Virgibacillus pantothenticus]MBU8567616.1 hypothetical protein [Virgibacillus pantothenticus]MBU8601404.1 hypothetical protein [Virgibacillus pantothenticus]MBU8636221.1 hypothetical protein [Virgibacillus pantothenticus]MBU8643741.1 hypothetical protein [Virgibacillus pantothenticus]MBU8648003.1 hypothetical protein [Virgibacillus pantothenticus]